MNKLEEQLIQAYATMVMGGGMTEEEVPETLVLIEGAEPTTMRKLAKLEVARRIIEELNKPEPEPTVTEETMSRIDAVEMALAGMMIMLSTLMMPEMPVFPEEPEIPEGPEEPTRPEEEGGDI